MGGSSDRRTENTTTTTNQNTNQTTTPVIVNPALNTGLTDYLNQINAFAGTNAADLVADPNQNQQTAWNQAADIAGSNNRWNGMFNQARDLAVSAGNATAPQATASTYNPVTNVQGQGYNASQANSQGYTPAQIAQAAQLARAQQATAQNAQSQSLLTNLKDYTNPYQSQVTNAYKSDFDQTAGQTRAAQAAQAAANGAFSGSRYGVQEAQTEEGLARARASGLASILQGGFDRATSLSADDATRRQAASVFNAGNQTQNSQFNAGQSNQMAQLQGQLNQQGLLANLGATNDARQFGAGAANTASLANAGFRNEASQFGANAQNTANLANQNAANQAGQFNAAALQQNSQFNAGQSSDQIARQLQASGLLGSLGSGLLNGQLAANQNLQNVGSDQYNIDQANATSQLSLLQSLGSLFGAFPSQLFTGQTSVGNANGTSNTNGTVTQTSNPGLLGTLGQIGGLVGMAANPLASLFAGGTRGSMSQGMG